MVVNVSPKARALGATLREETDACGYSLRTLAKRIGRDVSTVSRWFNGSRKVDRTDVAQILTVLGIAGRQYEEILALAHDAQASVWMPATMREHRQFMEALLRFERDATRIVSVTPLLIPGLLQTHSYVRAIMTSAGVPEDEVESRIRLRLGRQRVPETVPMTAMIGEAALHQQVGGPAVLARQLRHLLDVVADDSLQVDVRVIPFAAGWSPASEGGWHVMEFADAPTVIQMENRRGGVFMHDPDDVRLYLDAVDFVADRMMSPEESLAHIGKIIDRLEAERCDPPLGSGRWPPLTY